MGSVSLVIVAIDASCSFLVVVRNGSILEPAFVEP
jgi:hypothetical protein